MRNVSTMCISGITDCAIGCSTLSTGVKNPNHSSDNTALFKCHNISKSTGDLFNMHIVALNCESASYRVDTNSDY